MGLYEMLRNDFENLLCHQFEELLSDYLDKTLDKETHRAVAAHALRCPLCHDLLNEVKSTLKICQNYDLSEFASPSPSLEARILQSTMPETAISCAEFENLLTDYLDGFLPAEVFHRWERHAVLCDGCTNLPGEVVRSIGACYTYKADELPIPANLNKRILELTIGTANAEKVRMPLFEQLKENAGNIFKPIFTSLLTPQFASVAMMLLMAFVVFTNTNVADNSIGGVYQKGIQLAAQTYEQSASAVESSLAEGLNLNSQPKDEQFPTPGEETNK